MQKAFDWVDRGLLMHVLLKNGIQGGIYNCIKALYQNPLACVKVNEYFTDWFSINSGVRQGDPLSPTLFSIFINELIVEIKKLDIGVKIDNEFISVLAFADDIILSAENECDLQKL
jgi:hypothetical protein